MRAAVVGLVLAAGLAAGGVAAQDAGDRAATEFPGGCAPHEVPADGLCWDVPADQPVVSCVRSATEGIDGREAVTVTVFLRQPGGVAHLPPYPADPVGVFATLPVGSCVGLERLP